MLKAKPTDRPPVHKNNYRKQNKINNFSFNFKGSLPKKYLMIIIAMFAVFIVLAAFIGPMFVNLNVWKPEIVLLLEDLTDKKASIDGDVNLSIFPIPEVTIEDIKLLEKYEDENVEFLTLEKIRAKLTIWPLLRRKIVIEKVELDGFKLILQDSEDGTPNWSSNFQNDNQLDNTNLNENSVKYSKENEKLSDSNNISFADVDIKEYQFSNGLIVIKNNMASLNLGIEKLSILPTDQNNNFLVGILNIYGQEINFNSNFTNSEENKYFWDGYASFRHDDLNFNMDLSIEYKELYPHIIGQFTSSSDNLKNFFDALDIKSILGLDMELPMKAQGKLDLSVSEDKLIYEFEDLSLGLGATILTGTINGHGGLNPRVDIALSSNSIDLDTSEFSFSNYLLSLKEEDNNKNDDSLKDTELAYWKKLDGSLTLSVGTAKLYDYPIRDIILDLNKDAKDFVVKKASAVFPGNTKVKLNGNFGTQFEVFEGNLTFDTQDFRSYANWASFNKVDYLPQNRFRTINFNSNIAFRPGAATFVGIEGKFDNTNFTGEMRFRWGKENNISSTLMFDSINFDIYKNYPLDDEKNSPQLDITLKDKNKSFNFHEVFGNETDFNLNVFIRNAIFHGKKINGLKFLGSISKDLIKIENISVDNLQGLSLLAKGEVKMSNPTPNFDIELQINSDSRNLANFLEFPEKTKHIFSGKFISNFRLDGEISDFKTEINAEIADLNISYSGNVNLINFKVSKLEGAISLEHQNVGKFFAEKFGVKGDVYAGVGKFNTRIYYSDKDTLELKDIVFMSDNIEYKGNSKTTYDNNGLNFQSNINGNYMDMSDLLSFLKYFNITNFLYEKNGVKNNLLGNLRIQLDNFSVYDMELKSVKLYSKFNSENVEINSFDGEIYNGLFSINSSITRTENINLYSNFSLKGVDISILNKDIFGWEFIDGKLSVDIELESEIKDINKPSKNFQGKGKFEIRGANINGFDPNIIKNVNYTYSKKEIDQIIKNSYLNNASAIKNISGTVKIKNSKILFEKISLYFDQVNAELTGNVDLINKNSEIALNFNMEEEKGIKIGLIYSGNWDKIKKSVLINRVIKEETIAEKQLPLEENLDNIIDVINDESKGLEIKKSNIENKNIEDNTDDENLTNVVKKSEDSIDKIISNMEFPRLLKTKTLSNLSYFKYDKSIDPVSNDIIKPKKPSQEDLLDNVLDSILK